MAAATFPYTYTGMRSDLTDSGSQGWLQFACLPGLLESVIGHSPPTLIYTRHKSVLPILLYGLLMILFIPLCCISA